MVKHLIIAIKIRLYSHWKYYSHIVEGSSPVRGNFFAVFFCSNTILADLTE